DNVEFLERNLTDLASLAGRVDVAVGGYILLMSRGGGEGAALRQISATLKPGGRFLGILAAVGAGPCQTIVLFDSASGRGQPLDAARKNAAHLNDLALYDFAFGQFRFQGLDQHFWQPFEIRYRFARAGLKLLRKRKVHLSWSQFGGQESLKRYPPPWDWF